MCGEKAVGIDSPQRVLGSPPRVRGKVVHFFGAHLPDGITPACAGKSTTSDKLSHHRWDHPRVCGEKKSNLPSGVMAAGSPPRVRGKGPAALPLRGPARITPACAGKSLLFRLFSSGSWDHPRVCGEKYSLACCFWPASGSPPRVRGKVSVPGELAIAHRDHPRVCGEKAQPRAGSRRVRGSPPRVRGKAILSIGAAIVTGITPACAGKRSS